MHFEHMDAADLKQVWADFKAEKNDVRRLALRNQLVLHYTSLVRAVATKIGKRLPNSVDRDDLIAYGMFGLIDALDRFSLEKKVKFETYGIPRIHGAIMDELRRLDWVPRSVRSRARDIEAAKVEVEALHGKVTQQLLSRHLGISEHDLKILLDGANISHVESLAGFHEVIEMPDIAMNPQDIVETGEVASLLGEAIGSMDERSKVILTLYYVHEMTLAEIGKILGVTESRVCQLQSKVLVTLGESLGQGGLAVA